MIGRLSGTVEDLEGSIILVDVGGVGYEVQPSRKLRARLRSGERATFCVYTDVKEDSIRLFGFDDSTERRVFTLLLRVSGLGPRLSIDILSNIDRVILLRAIGQGDISSLLQVKGIGRKKAERIVVELKDIVGSFSQEYSGLASEIEVESYGGGSEAANDAVAALAALGFPRKDAEAAVSRAVQSGSGSEAGDLVREALRFI